MRSKSSCYRLTPFAYPSLIYRTHTIFSHAHEPSAACCHLNSAAGGLGCNSTVSLMHFTKKCCDRTVPSFNLEHTWMYISYTTCQLHSGALNAENGGHALRLYYHTMGVCSESSSSVLHIEQFCVTPHNVVTAHVEAQSSYASIFFFGGFIVSSRKLLLPRCGRTMVSLAPG
jgi:hypothetical protein